MKRRVSRIMAFALSVMMLVTSVPVTAFANEAQGGQNYSEEVTGSTEESVVSSVESSDESSEESSQEVVATSLEEEALSSEAASEEVSESGLEEESEMMSESEVTTEVEPITETETEMALTEADNLSDEEEEADCVITFSAGEHITIYDAAGENAIDSITVPYGSTEAISFKPVVEAGYTVLSVQSTGSFKFICNDEGIYTGTPRKTGVTEDIEVTVVETEIAEYTVEFVNTDEVDGFQAMANGEDITLTDGAVTVTNDERITFKLKAKAGTVVRTGYKMADDEEDIAQMDVYNTDEEGYSYYVLGKVNDNYTVTIYVEEGYKIDFTTSNVSVLEIFPYDDWCDTGAYINDTVTVVKGDSFYFALEGVYEIGTPFVSTDGAESGEIEPYCNMDGYSIYQVTPESDMTVTASWIPKEIPITYGALEDLSISAENDTSEVADDYSSVSIYEETTIDISFKPLTDKIYNVYYTYSSYEPKTDENGDSIYDENGDEIYEWVDYSEDVERSDDGETGIYSYTVRLSGNVKSVIISAKQAYTINFDTTNANVKRVTFDSYGDEWNEVSDGELTSEKVAEGTNYYFIAVPVKGSSKYMTQFVSTDGTESGKLDAYAYSGSYPVYKVVPASDMNITVKVLPKSVPVTYPEDLEDFSVTVSDEDLAEVETDLSAVNVYDLTTAEFQFKADSSKTYNAYYTYDGQIEVVDDNGDTVYDENGDTVYKHIEYSKEVVLSLTEDDDGDYYSFSIEMESSVKDITITAGEAWTVGFTTQNNTSVKKATLYNDETGYVLADEYIESGVNVCKGESLYFYVEQPYGAYGIPYVSTDGTDTGKIEPYWKQDSTYIYKVTPEANMNITVDVKPMSVAVNTPDTLEELSITTSSDDCSIATDKKTISTYDAAEVSFKFKADESKKYSAYWNYTEKRMVYDSEGNVKVDKNGNIQYKYMDYELKLKLTEEVDEDGNATGYYTFDVTLNSGTTAITIMEADACKLSFELDDKVSVKEIYFYSGENWYDEGNAVTDEVYVGVGEPFYFKVEADSVMYYTYEISTEDGEIDPYWVDDGSYVYKVTPTEDTKVTVKLIPNSIALEGVDTLNDFSITTASDMVVVAEDNQTIGIYDDASVTMKFKPEADKLYSAYYTYCEWDWEYDEETDTDKSVKYEYKEYLELEMDEDGYYSFTVPLDGTTESVTIVSKETNAVTFAITNAQVYEVYKYVEDWGDGEVYTYYETSDEIIGTKRVAEGSTLYFKVLVEETGSLATALVSTDGTEAGKLNFSAWNDDGEGIYAVTPTEDMEITVKAVPKTIPLQGGDTLTDFTVISTNDAVTLAEDKASISTYRETDVTMKFKPEADKLYSAYYTYYEWDWVYDEETDTEEEVRYEYNAYAELEMDEEGYYSFTVSLDSTIKSVTIVSKETNAVTFATTNAQVYEVYKYVDDWGDGEVYTYYETGDEIVEAKRVAEGSTLYFKVSVEEAGNLATSFVSTDGTEAGKLSYSVWTEDGEGVYAVTPTEDMEITVKAVPKTIPLQGGDTLTDFTVTSTNDTVTLAEDKASISTYYETDITLRFKPEADKHYSVYNNYYEWDYLTDENGDYIWDPETDDYKYGQIHCREEIYPEVDEDGYYTYSLYVANNTESFTIDAAQLREVKFVSKYGQATAYSCDTGDSLSTISLPEGKVFAFWVDVNEGSTLKYVTTTGDENGKVEGSYDEDYGTVLYKITPQGNMTVTLVDVPDERNISFDNQSSNMTLSVQTNDNVTKTENNIYVANSSATTIDFTITVSASKIEPGVTYVDETGAVIPVSYGKKTKADNGSRTYEYSVELEALPYPAKLTIQEAVEQYDVVVSYDEKKLASITAATESEEAAPVSSLSEEGKILFRVHRGETLTIDMTAKDNCRITQVATTQGETVTNEAMKTSSYELVVSAITDTQVVVSTQTQPEISVVQIMSDGTKVNLSNQAASQMSILAGRYKLAEGSYAASLLGEDGNAITLSEVKTSLRFTDYIKLSADKKMVEIDAKALLKTEKRATAIVYLTDINGSRAALRLEMRPDVDSMELSGVSDGRVSVEVDSIKYIRTILTPSTTNMDMVGIEVTVAEGMPKDSVMVSLAGRYLKIEASSADPAENVATVKLYRKNYLPTDADYYIEGAAFTVTTVSPEALEKGQPDVKAEASDDRTITLSVKPQDGVKECRTGKQYYKVVVTPQTVEGESIPETISAATAVPFYFEREIPDFSDVENWEEAEEAQESFRQNISITVNNASYGYGQAWKYDISVSLVQTKDATELNADNEAECVAYRSKETSLTDITTKDPVFETKLSVKKKATKIYTTQENVVVGIIGFSAATTNKDVVVKDVTECTESEKLQAVVAGNEILVSAGSETKPGKHTIEVAPMGPEGMYQTGKTLTVTVEKGIEGLELQIPSYRLYKQDNKAVSMTAKVVYNPDDSAPKTKKVTWSVVDESGEAFTADDELYNMITIKKGKVTVKKTLNLSKDASFRIKAEAADFAGNETSVMSDVITITSTAQEIETLLVVKRNPETYYYDVVAKEGSKVTSDLVSGAEVIALEKNAPVKTSYTITELATYKLSVNDVNYKSSNKAVKLVTENGKVKVSVSKTAKNVKLTATTTDGAKKSMTMKMDIVYLTPAELAVGMYQDGTSLAAIATENVTFSGTINTRITLAVKQKVEKTSDWSDVSGFTNHSIKVKNAKIVSSDTEKGIYEIVVTNAAAMITFQDKANGVKTVYKLTNSAYGSQKAPKVKAGAQLKTATVEKQTIEFTLPDNYDSQKKYVIAELNETAKMKKKNDYSVIEEACDQLGSLIAVQNKKFTLSFEGMDLPKGSYKLNVTIGTVGADGIFKADVKPATVTLKAASPKVTKGSFKLTTSYKMEASAGASVLLTGKSQNVKSVTFEKLYNANVKGSENDFTTYFELDGNKLVLKKSLTPEALQFITSNAGKDHLSGYITYTAVYGDDGYGNPYTQTKTVKLTIKFKK